MEAGRRRRKVGRESDWIACKETKEEERCPWRVRKGSVESKSAGEVCYDNTKFGWKASSFPQEGSSACYILSGVEVARSTKPSWIETFRYLWVRFWEETERSLYQSVSLPPCRKPWWVVLDLIVRLSKESWLICHFLCIFVFRLKATELRNVIIAAHCNTWLSKTLVITTLLIFCLVKMTLQREATKLCTCTD